MAEKKETWMDWMPEGVPAPPLSSLLTREEIVAYPYLRMYNVTTDDLRYWEQQGILPKPIRKFRHGAVRALYPSWFVYAVLLLKKMQHQQMRLSDIREELRHQVQLEGFIQQYANLRPEDIITKAEIVITAVNTEGETKEHVAYFRKVYPESVARTQQLAKNRQV